MGPNMEAGATAEASAFSTGLQRDTDAISQLVIRAKRAG